MRFGKSQAEAAEEPGRGGGGDYMRYLKDDPVTVRILQEPSEWTYFWEHFSPMGFSFPCPRDADDPLEICPGCSSDNEKMKKASRKIAFSILHSVNGQEYVDAFKVGPMISEKLENRFKRWGTVTDRDYTLSRYKTGADRWDFEVEGSPTASPIDLTKYEVKDMEALLQASWDDAWGDDGQGKKDPWNGEGEERAPAQKRVSIAAAPKPVQSEEPPFEEETVREQDLRAMEHAELLVWIKDKMNLEPPSTLTTSDAVVDWLMSLQS